MKADADIDTGSGATRFITTLRRELNWLFIQLMPPHCPACHTTLSASNSSATGLCQQCASQCRHQPPASCPRCGEPYTSTNTADHLCIHCLTRPPSFTWLKSAGIYNENTAQIIHRFKYGGKPALAAPLAQCMLEQLAPDIANFKAQLVVPVPLHISRLRQRGYNQSLLLARQMAGKLHLPVCANALERIRPTNPQALLSARQRRDNLHAAFAIRSELPAQRILLVDDIATTTTTARACSDILAKQGHSVAVITFARASLT